jgi:PHP family Zn ribbon phosphoesterase
MNERNRSGVPRQTSYRKPVEQPVNRVCASCGERIKDGAAWRLEAVEGISVDMPVHYPECSLEAGN